MAADWLEVPLSEIADIFDGPHATPRPTLQGPVFLGISSLEDGRLNLSDARHLSEADYQKWTRRVTPQANDLLFSYETRLGEAALMPAGLRACLGRRMGLLRPKHGKVDPRYLLYAYLGPQVQRTLRSRMVYGSTVDRIPLKEMGRFPVRVPASLKEQEAIATALGTLDDKIELNRRMGETLEAIAKELFQGWFVDRLALPDWATPESWPEVPLGELVIEEKRKVNPLQVPGTVFEHFSLPAYDTGAGPALDVGQSIKSAKTRVPKGSILLSRLNPRIPRVWLTEVDSPDRAIASTEFLVLTPRASVGRAFAYLTVSSNAFQQKLISMATGTSGSHQRVRPAAALAVTAVRPEPGVLQIFGAAVEPLLDRRLNAERQNRVLKHLRDALLPKLISGELRIPDAERLVSEVN